MFFLLLNTQEHRVIRRSYDKDDMSLKAST